MAPPIVASSLVLFAALSAACSAAPGTPSETGPSESTAPASAPASHPSEGLVTFQGSFDPATNALEVTYRSPSGAVLARETNGLRSDSIPEGSGTNEVVAHTLPGSVYYESGTYTHCTSGNAGDVARLCGNVEIESNLVYNLTSVSAAIDTVTGTGNAAFGAPYSYGSVAAGATSSVVQWSFSLATPSSFSFLGHINGTLPNCAAILAVTSSSTTGVYTIAPGGTSISAYCDMVTLGGGWTEVADDQWSIAGGAPISKWVGPTSITSPNNGVYSILNMLPQVHTGTDYTFYLDFTGVGYETWTQVQNPTTVTSGFPTLVGSVTYSPSPQMGDPTAGSFEGLFVSSNTSAYLAADSRNRSGGNWFWAVGVTTAWGSNGIPAFNAISAVRSTLYVK